MMYPGGIKGTYFGSVDIPIRKLRTHIIWNCTETERRNFVDHIAVEMEC